MRRLVRAASFLLLVACSVVFPLLTKPVHAQQRQALQTRVAAPVDARVVGRMPGLQRLSLALTLPLRNQEQLDTLLQQLDDRTSPNYHRYLTSAQFTEQFGPTVAEYQQVVDFAQSHGLTVTHTSPSRMLLDVSGSVADIELAFQLTMQVYQHPTENRTFYAPNVDPTVEAGIPMLGAAGLTDRVLRHPASLHRVAPGSVHPDTTGSGSGGQFYGSDIRAAYYGTGPLTGGGQALALAEGPWNVSDIQAYFKSVNQALNVPIVNEVLTGQNPNCIGLPPSCDDGEEVIDIEQIISMAPGASVLIVYEGVSEVDEFDAYATDNIAKVMSFSFGVGSSNATSDEQQFARFHAQGQNFFVASGDGGDFNGTGGWPGFSQNVTDVGGTDLVTSSPGGPWQSETGWIGSGGGWCDSTIPPPNGPCYQSPYDAIPNYQVQVITAANGGSTLYRNVPDVAAEANTDNFFCANGSCQGGIGGTSLAAPRFAGFVALANEQAAANGEMVGFLNTTVYAIGQASNYNTAFHDITSGSNNGFNAVVGYDLVTGWGTPNGQGMIDALAPTGGTSPYFTVSASPTTLNVTPGGAGQTSIISLTAANGFTGTVALTANVLGAPAGVTATLSPTSITAGQTSTLTVAADSSTNSSTFVNGNVEVVVTGTSAGGIQTQPAYVTLGVPDFALSAAPSGVYLNQSSTVNSTVTVTPQNGFGGSVTFSSVTGLPSGVTASFNPTSTTSTSTLTLTASSTAATGPGSALNVIGTSGNITQYAPATTLSVSAATGTGGSGTPVDLSSAYNLNGIYTDGTPFTTGVDGLGSAYSSNLLTGNRILNGVQFNFGPANKLDAVSDTGQSITLPAGQFTTLQLLATSFNGPVLSQTITVTYTDTTTSTFTQGFSDWCGCSTNPGGQAGESFAVVMPYRDLSTGKQDDTPFNLYGYTFVLNSAKTVKSITLPNNKNVVVLAATLTSQSLGTPVSLSSEYNIAGIFANGVTFEGTGDIDGTADTDACGLSSGCSDAYSEQQLGLTPTTPPTLTIKGTTFNFGTVNTADCGTGFPACISDVIDLTTAPGVTIPLPSGQQTAYTTLSMLGTAVNGSQTGTVTVTYTTGSPKTIDQAFSDWCNFTHNPNESIAVGAINRINSDGTLATGVPCNLYAYTYTLDSTRTVQSITLTYTGSSAPGDGAFVLAITLSGNTTTGPGFTLSAAPSSLSIAQGTGNTSTITMTPSGGFTGSVGLAATGLPSGVTASFNPTSTTGTSTLTLTASSSATTGPATVTVTGTSGSLTATTTISLTVTPPPNFTLSASPTTLSVAQGGNHTSTITVEPTNGFTGSVTLAASGLPTGVTAAFGTNPTTGTSVLTLTASSSAPIISNATVTIIGTSGSLTAPTTISLTVTPPANFTLSASPTSLSVAESGSNTSTITVNPTNGFTGSVMLAASALPSGVTAAFGTNPTTGTSVLTLTASSSAPIISNATVTVTGTSGSLTAPTTISLAVTPPESYALSTVGPTQGTIAPGGSSQATVTVTPANGYTGSVNLTCTVTSTVTFTPPQATCSASPNPVVLTANETSPPTSTLTFTTQGPSGAMIRHASTFYALWLPVPGLALIGLGLGSRDTRRKKLLGCLLLWIVLASLIVLPACGSSGNGGGGGGNPGTPAGTYTLTITGKDAANGLTQSNTAPTTVSVTVN